MKKITFFFLAVLMVSGCVSKADEAVAPVAVPVGKGSYASAPPPETRDVVKDTPERELYVMGPKRPIPTNGWWTNLLVDRYAGQIWSFPHQIKADKEGIELTYPTRWNDEGRDPVSE